MSETTEAPAEGVGNLEVGEPAVPSWKESLPADLASHPTIKETRDIPNLARQLVSAQELIGRSGVKRPNKEDPEDVNRYYTELGRPESADDYNLASLRPEGLPWDESMEGTMASAFHSAGLSTEQAQAVQSRMVEVAKEQYESSQGQLEEANRAARQQLQSKWGNAYQGNIDLANRAFAAHAGDAMQEMANTTLSNGIKLGNWGPFIEFMASLGQKQAEHGLIGEREGRRFTRTPDEAQREIRKLEADEDFQAAYFDGNHIEHDDAVARMSQLYKVAYDTDG